MTFERPKSVHTPLFPIPTGRSPSGHLKTPVHCVLFDVYGTLFISGSGDIATVGQSTHLAEALVAVLRRHNLDRDAGQVVERLFAAIETDHRHKKAAGTDFPEVDMVRIWRQVLGSGLPIGFSVEEFAIDYERMANPVYPMPHLMETINALRDRGMAMGIISNAQFFTPLLFEWFLGKPMGDLGFDPDLVFFSYRHGVAKPSLSLFLKAKTSLEACGIAPSAVLYIGNDMRNDILPASKTGFKTALFAGDARSLRMRTEIASCATLQPDLVITDLAQLLIYITADDYDNKSEHSNTAVKRSDKFNAIH
ncbi:MAG: HAD family hydrolase [Desulfobacterales bacterium]|nr:HAD family hydrolase [Desulfobacterales bacterium]